MIIVTGAIGHVGHRKFIIGHALASVKPLREVPRWRCEGLNDGIFVRSSARSNATQLIRARKSLPCARPRDAPCRSVAFSEEAEGYQPDPHATAITDGAPQLGAHNAYGLGETLGLSAEEHRLAEACTSR
jgi:hypothetical protein